LACGGGGFAGPAPVATLASSPPAQGAFDAIRAGWTDPSVTPAALRARVDDFLVRYPRDGLAPLARVLLALVALRQGELGTADAALEQTRHLPMGTTHDFWTIARAKQLRLGGQPEAAMALLRPDIGKDVDPLARTLFQEELTLTAIATHRDYEAVTYMDAWLRASPLEERSATVERVSALVERLPRDVLINALQAMRQQRTTLGYGADIERILSDRLVHIATANDDAVLARMLVDADAGAIVLAGEAGGVIGQLATSRRGLNVVEGRTVGLLLPTSSAALRDESADVLRGVMWALGLPGGGTSSAPTSTPEKPGATDGGLTAPCGELDDAPDELPADDDARIVTRNAAGSDDRVDTALDELAGEGASVILAALDPSTATVALRWSERHGVAVIALVPPAEAPKGMSFGFEAGESRARVLDVLERADPALGGARVAHVVDESDLATAPPSGGTAAAREPRVSCDVAPAHAGDPRFPVEAWAAARTTAWIASGSADCSGDLVRDLDRSRARGTVALTLEGAATPRHGDALRVLTAQAGVLPTPAPDDPRAASVHRFAELSGRVDWWAAIGRDAGTLARLAVLRLPTDSVSDRPTVRERRNAARDALLAARARLWTTGAAGFDAAHALERDVCAVEIPPRGL
jgi:hypothetical protein